MSTNPTTQSTTALEEMAQSLGPGQLERAYLRATSQLVLTLRHASVLLSQHELRLPGGDPVLVTRVCSFQKQMRDSARFVSERVLKSQVELLTTSQGFTNLMDSALSSQFGLQVKPGQAEATPEHATEVFHALSDRSNGLVVASESLEARAGEVKRQTKDVQEPFEQGLVAILDGMDAEAKALAEEIEQRSLAIGVALDEAVDGFESVGQSVTDLGTGILTMITSAPGGKDKNGESEQEQAPEKDSGTKSSAITKAKKSVPPKGKTGQGEGKEKPKPASTDFAVKAVKASRSGAERGTSALRSLNRLNDEQAAAFQKMAARSVHIAAGLAVGEQCRLFSSSIKRLVEAVVEVTAEWKRIRGSYDAVGNAKRDDTATLQRAARSIQPKWKALQETIRESSAAVTDFQL